MNTVRIAVIGVGTMGKKYAKMIADGEIAHMRLAAVCCRSQENTQWVKQELGEQVPVFPDAESLYERGELFDASLIVTPHKLHPQMIEQAMRDGKHVFCDKPVGISMKQCEGLAELAGKRKVKFAVMFHQRMYAKYVRLKEILDSGKMGAVRRIMMENSRYYRTEHYHKSGSWRSSWTGEGGGALINQGQHLLDIWQWLFGMPERVLAFIPYGKYNDFAVDDEATVFMSYPGKETAVFFLTTGEGTWTERLEIAGSKGSLLLEGSRLTIRTYNRDLREYGKNAGCNSREELKESVSVEEFPETGEPYREMLEDFAEAVLEDRPVRVDGLEGLRALELTNAAYLSAWLGQSVRLPVDEELYEKELQKRIQEERA